MVSFDTPDGEPVSRTESFMYKTTKIPHPFSSCISDSNGKLLLSTDGRYIYSYTKEPTVLDDGGLFPQSELSIKRSFLRSSLIVKKPGSDSLYYVFTTYHEVEYPYVDSAKICYSIVDLSKNDGKGEIIEFKTVISDGYYSNILGIMHSNGKDIWIIMHIGNTTKEYRTYLLTKNGIDLKKVKITSSAFYGENYDQSISNLSGDLVFFYLHNKLEFFRFNKEKGVLSPLINLYLDSLVFPSYNIYYYHSYQQGIALSPDSKKMYISSNVKSKEGINKFCLLQMDISQFDMEYFQNNISIISLSDTTFNGMKLAPNGKIYIVRQYVYSVINQPKYLSIINNPNEKGKSCNFEEVGTTFASINPETNASYFAPHSLPNTVVYGGGEFEAKISVSNTCAGDTMILTAEFKPDYSTNKYSWRTPWEEYTNTKEISIPIVSEIDSGWYYLSVDLNGSLYKDSVYIHINPKPIAKILGNPYICKNSFTILEADTCTNCSYHWSTGETTSSIQTNKIGTYILTVENEFGCKSSDTIEVLNNEEMIFEIKGGTHLCLGDTLTLTSDIEDSNYSYLWSTGETSPTIKITKGGQYWLKIVSDEGCEGADTVNIIESIKPQVTFSQEKYTICSGDTVLLFPNEIDQDNEYIWSDGVLGAERKITESKTLNLIVKNKNGCSDTAYVEVIVIEKPKSEIVADRTEACFGEEIQLSSKYQADTYSYKWSTGETTDSIKVQESGTYKLYITNEKMCIDSAAITVTIYPEINLSILYESDIICNGKPLILTSNDTYETYLWSTGASTQSIEVTEAGTYWLKVQNGNCEDSASINVKVYEAQISVNPTELYFTTDCIGESEEHTVTITMTGAEEFNISKISTKNKDIEISPNVGLIKSGETFTINVKYKAETLDLLNDTLLIESEKPCPSKYRIPIHISTKQELSFKYPDIETVAGSELEIPLTTKILCPSPDQLELTYEMEVSINKEYFKLDSVGNSKLIDYKIIGNDRYIKYQTTSTIHQESSITTKLYGKALIGGSQTVPIHIGNITTNYAQIQTQAEDGSLTIKECVNDLRGIKLFKPTSMILHPNPTDKDVNINISSEEEGAFTLIMTDVSGVEIYRTSYNKTNRILENKELHIPTNDLSNGLYLVRLHSPWNVISKQVLINR